MLQYGVAEFTIFRLSLRKPDVKHIVCSVFWVKQFLSFHALPPPFAQVACEGILSVMQLGNSLINASAMQALYSVMVSKPSPEVFPTGTNAALITALTTGTSGVPGSLAAVIPSMNDSQPACAWITVLTAALLNLFRWVAFWSLLSRHLGFFFIVIGQGRIKKKGILIKKINIFFCQLFPKIVVSVFVGIYCIFHLFFYYRTDEEEGMKYITTWFVQLVPFWCSEHNDVHSKVNFMLHICSLESILKM